MVLWWELNKSIYKGRMLQSLWVVLVFVWVTVCVCVVVFTYLFPTFPLWQSLVPVDDEITVVVLPVTPGLKVTYIYRVCSCFGGNSVNQSKTMDKLNKNSCCKSSQPPPYAHSQPTAAAYRRTQLQAETLMQSASGD